MESAVIFFLFFIYKVMRREGNVSGCCGVVCVPRREFRTVERWREVELRNNTFLFVGQCVKGIKVTFIFFFSFLYISATIFRK